MEKLKTQVTAVASALPCMLDSEIQLDAGCRPRLIPSRELLDEEGRLLIDHYGKFYMLRSLPGGRLILTGWDGASRHGANRSSAR
jgi:hemin uptake protein HemP